MSKLRPNGAWGTAPDDNDDAMDLYQNHVIQPLQQSLLDMFDVESADAERGFLPEADIVWARIGVLVELKEEAPGMWRQMFDPIIDDKEAQAILNFAFEDLNWLRQQYDWFERWEHPAAVKRSISRWERILLEWMSRRTLGAGTHRR